MANRFAKRIRSGEIASIDELKSEFKAIAKLTHPDVAGPGVDLGGFAALRDEYEAALRDFSKHRFGARGAPAGEAGTRGDDGRFRPDGSSPGEALGDAAWPRLALLLDRGFPKAPRHEKEALRYEYARWRLQEALGPAASAFFAESEAELLDMRASRAPALRRFLGFLRLLIEYSGSRLPAMRTELVLELGALRADPLVGPGTRGLAQALAGSLGIGGEIGPTEADASPVRGPPVGSGFRPI